MDEYVFCEYDPDKEDEYAWALCGCAPMGYGIRIKRKPENHFFSFKCPNCGTQLGITLRGTNPDCPYL